MLSALLQLRGLELFSHLKAFEIQKRKHPYIPCPVDALPIPGDISFGLLAMAVFHIKDTEKDHKLFLGQCTIFYVIVRFVIRQL